MLGKVLKVSILYLDFPYDWLVIIQIIILRCVMHSERQGWYVSGGVGVTLCYYRHQLMVV